MKTKNFKVMSRVAADGTLLDIASIEQLANGTFNALYAYSQRDRQYKTMQGAVKFLTSKNYK